MAENNTTTTTKANEKTPAAARASTGKMPADVKTTTDANPPTKAP